MNFEECKKVFYQYLEGQITKDDLKKWGAKHCTICTECAYHCEKCPLFIDELCRFGE